MNLKTKVSVTIAPELVEEIDRLIAGEMSRSQFVEAALKRRVRELKHQSQQESELAILNAIADGELGEPPDASQFGSQHYWEERAT